MQPCTLPDLGGVISLRFRSTSQTALRSRLQHHVPPHVGTEPRIRRHGVRAPAQKQLVSCTSRRCNHFCLCQSFLQPQSPHCRREERSTVSTISEQRGRAAVASTESDTSACTFSESCVCKPISPRPPRIAGLEFMRMVCRIRNSVALAGGDLSVPAFTKVSGRYIFSQTIYRSTSRPASDASRLASQQRRPAQEKSCSNLPARQAHTEGLI